ncbi:MAG: hypothetical protein AAF802_01290 [Planctomycetota bacterium]
MSDQNPSKQAPAIPVSVTVAKETLNLAKLGDRNATVSHSMHPVSAQVPATESDRPSISNETQFPSDGSSRSIMPTVEVTTQDLRVNETAVPDFDRKSTSEPTIASAVNQTGNANPKPFEIDQPTPPSTSIFPNSERNRVPQARGQSERSAAEMNATHEPPQTVHVNIGRIEIRAANPSGPIKPKSKTQPTVMSLESYLRRGGNAS